jgi:competence ComEA-like helix-hairpin-helix protein
LKTTELDAAKPSQPMALLIATALLLAMPALSLDSRASTLAAEPTVRQIKVERSSETPGGPTVQVDVNTATAAELERIKGIGPRIAARIVQARERGGRFRDADDLRQRVSGIGAAKLKSMRSAGLLVPEPRAAMLPLPRTDRIELISGQPPGKREAGRGGAIFVPGEPARR